MQNASSIFAAAAALGLGAQIYPVISRSTGGLNHRHSHDHVHGPDCNHGEGYGISAEQLAADAAAYGEIERQGKLRKQAAEERQAARNAKRLAAAKKTKGAVIGLAPALFGEPALDTEKAIAYGQRLDREEAETVPGITAADLAGIMAAGVVNGTYDPNDSFNKASAEREGAELPADLAAYIDGRVALYGGEFGQRDVRNALTGVAKMFMANHGEPVPLDTLVAMERHIVRLCDIPLAVAQVASPVPAQHVYSAFTEQQLLRLTWIEANLPKAVRKSMDEATKKDLLDSRVERRGLKLPKGYQPADAAALLKWAVVTVS